MRLHNTGSVLLVLLAPALVHAVSEGKYGTYPSTYPYEKEEASNIPPALPKGAPNKKFDTSDPGGYFYNGVQMLDFNEIDDSPSFGYMWGWDHWWFKAYTQTLTSGGAKAWNCTAANTPPNKFSRSNFPGKLNGVDVGCGDKCCRAWDGHVKFAELSKSDHETTGKKLPTLGCDISKMGEGAYCAITDTMVVACNEYYTSRSTRSVSEACPQVVYLYYMTCKLLKSTGTAGDNLMALAEPQKYLDILAVDESVHVYSMIFAHDRVCLPYSYYYPTDGDSAPGSASGAYSVSATTALSVAIAFAIL